MFTGIIEEIGQVTAVKSIRNGKELSIAAERIFSDLKEEDSVNINGACQTVININENQFRVEAVGDTINKTTLGKLKIGSKVNLERALTLNTRMGGHIVAGHVNGTGTVLEIAPKGDNWFYYIQLDSDLMKYCVNEGSISIDGVSLTIAEKTSSGIRISAISHTRNHTIFKFYQPGIKVNVEVDLIAKYLESLLENRGPGTGGFLSQGQLKEWGF